MKLGLVFTNDWELYGDGTGDYFEIQHRPLESLAKALENHGAKLTVMAEIGQHWSHMALADKFSWASEVASAWDSVLIRMVQKNHDVQLHLHPQWLGAEYDGQRWILNFDKWACSNLTVQEMEEALMKGKTYLEALFSNVNPEYRCVAFRSGAYCSQPSSELISCLVRNGFVCDTSITKGMKEDSLFDFTDACSNFFPWFVDPVSIEKKAKKPSGLIEIPIYSKALWDSPVLRWKLGVFYGTLLKPNEKKWFKQNDRIFNTRYPQKNRPLGRRFKLIYLVQAVLRKTVLQLDYDRLSAEVFARMLKHVTRDAQNQKLDDPTIILPVIATGHTKNMYNTENIERILDRLQPLLKDDKITFWTLTEAVKYWFERLNGNSGNTYVNQD